MHAYKAYINSFPVPYKASCDMSPLLIIPRQMAHMTEGKAVDSIMLVTCVMNFLQTLHIDLQDVVTLARYISATHLRGPPEIRGETSNMHKCCHVYLGVRP